MSSDPNPEKAQLGTFFTSVHFPSGSPFHHPCALLQAMPERELWPAGLCSEPVTHIGSCGGMMSTTSTHSGSSDSSYDFLSAEEKECLLFLEKTIGSLEAEADSGLSTDESEPATSPRSFRALPAATTTTPQQTPQGKPEALDIQQVPVPKRVAQASGPPESHSLGLRSGSYSLPRNLHLGRSQNVRESATQTNSPTSEASKVFLEEPEKGQTSQGAKTVQPPAPSQKGTLDLNTVLIPPPAAFQDISPKKSGEERTPKKPGEQTHTPRGHSPDRRPHSQKNVEMSSETMSHKATKKGWTEGPQPPAQPSQNTKADEPSLPSGVKPNIQQAPLTATKARKLPPNIVLKSSRSSFHSHPQNWLSNHTEATDSGPVSSLQEQRKARREALEKLGLPQDQDDASLLVNKQTGTLKVKEAQAQSPSQARAPAQSASSAAAAAALVSGTASAAGKPSPVKAVTPMDSLSKGWVPTQESPPGKAVAAKSMPIPIPKASKENSSLTQPKSDPRLTLQESSIPGLRQMNFKSNTLERSGVGLSSYLSAAEKEPSCQTSTSLGKSPFPDKVSPSVFRNSRPRPASLGMGKDFAGIQGGKLVGLEQDRCSSQQPSFKGQSHDRLPRPPCVSVKIAPKGIPDGHRREALKKLGLLKE